MINICIYEDNYYKQLLPLTYNRPVYDLLIGTNSILDKVKQFFNYANISLHCRNELKPTLKEKLPKNAINSINNGTPCLFINGRTIMTQSLYNILAQLNPAHNHLLLYKGHIIATYLRGEELDNIIETQKILDEVIKYILQSLKYQHNYEVNKYYVIRPDNVKIELNDKSKVKIIARLIQEDILVHQLDPIDNLYKLTAGALCFPSFWTLSQKMGMNLERIHKPVPEFTKEIARRVDRLFLGLKVDQPIWRANWTVKNNPILFNPLLEDDKLPEPFTTEKEWWVRVERQTFTKLPVSGAVIFGIHTFIASPSSLNEEQLGTLKNKIKVKSLIHHKQAS